LSSLLYTLTHIFSFLSLSLSLSLTHTHKHTLAHIYTRDTVLWDVFTHDLTAISWQDLHIMQQ
jgi:hypothetical protein